jgi:hypothetical protein
MSTLTKADTPPYLDIYQLAQMYPAKAVKIILRLLPQKGWSFTSPNTMIWKLLLMSLSLID